MIYCDNAATTQIDERVLESMMPYLTNEYGNASTLYQLGYDAKKAIEKSRKIIAEYINCSPSEIFFTSGGTEGDNWVIKSGSFCHVFCSPIEHPAVLRSVFDSNKVSPYNHIKVSYDGIIETGSLEKSFNNYPYNDSVLVSCMTVNSETGCIQPIGELCQIAHEHNALFHTDAVQAIGHIPIDVQKNKVDFLTVSGHKIYAPKGIGFCYIKNGANLFPYMSGGGQEIGMRSGTENVAGIVGLGKAIELLDSYVLPDTQLFKNNLNNKIIINGKNCINTTFNLYLPNIKATTMQMELAIHDIYVSTGSACHSGKDEPSAVLKAMGRSNEQATQSIRVSFGKNNTDKDCITVAKAINRIYNKFTKN